MSLCSVIQQCVLPDLSHSGEGQDAFEVHVTVEPLLPVQHAFFRAVCRDLGVKALILDLGANLPTQPMTCSRVQGTLPQAHAEAQRVAQAFNGSGLRVTRIKLEAAPWNSDLPTSGAGYYEHHARLCLSDVPTQEPTLRELCRHLGLHLSRNPFKVGENGSQQRFVTLRHPPTERNVAAKRAADTWQALAQAGFPPEKTVTEFCVYDSNRALDAAWEQRV